jgi:hypothetical protein
MSVFFALMWDIPVCGRFYIYVFGHWHLLVSFGFQIETWPNNLCHVHMLLLDDCTV